MAPRSGSKSRSSSAISVLLPEPVGPTTAVIVPTRASNVDVLERGAVRGVAEARRRGSACRGAAAAASTRVRRVAAPRARGRAPRTRGRGRPRRPARGPRCGTARAQLAGAVAEALLEELEEAEVPGREAERRDARCALGAAQRAQRRERPGRAPSPTPATQKSATRKIASRLRASKAASKARAARGLEARLLARLGAVGLEHADPRQRLLDARGERAVGLARAAEARAQAAREPERRAPAAAARARRAAARARVEERHRSRREEEACRAWRAASATARRSAASPSRCPGSCGRSRRRRVLSAWKRSESACSALEQRDAQVLVDALQDPDLVVVERHRRASPRRRRARRRRSRARAALRRSSGVSAAGSTKRAGSRPSRPASNGQQRLALRARASRTLSKSSTPSGRKSSARPAKAPNSAATWRRTGRSSRTQRSSRPTTTRKRSRSSLPPVPRAARCARASSAAWLIRGSGPRARGGQGYANFRKGSGLEL